MNKYNLKIMKIEKFAIISNFLKKKISIIKILLI